MAAGVRAISIVLAASALTAGACSEQPWPARRAAISDGVADDGHPAVGIFLIGADQGTADSICTGTLVGTKTVLLATHCLEDVTPPKKNLFQLGGVLHEVAEMVRHPDWTDESPKYVDDIGLAVLQTASTVQPIEVVRIAPQTGMNVKVVGFGVTQEGGGDAGDKRVAANQVASVYGQYFTITGSGNTCAGDSGGPVLLESGGREVVIGVVSAATEPCGSKSYHVRADHYYDWLAEEAAGDLYASDVEDPTVTIDAPADGATVSSLVTLAVSASDDRGVAEVEAYVDGESVGKKTAAPFSFGLSLTSGPHLLKATARDAAGNSASAEVSVTVDPALPPADGGPGGDGGVEDSAAGAAFGADCSSDSDCLSGVCRRDEASDRLYCTEHCTPDSCPAGSDCVALGVEFICTPRAADDGGGCCSVAHGQRPLGWCLAALLALLALGRRRRG